MVDVFRKGKYEFLAFTDTKLKGNGEFSCCGVNGIIVGVQEIERDREVVTVLMNGVWHSILIDFGDISSRPLWVNFKFSSRVCMLVIYGPTEVDVEGSEKFWNDLDRVIDRTDNGYRLCVLGDMNGSEVG